MDIHGYTWIYMDIHGYTTSNCSICNCSMQTSTASLCASHLGPCKCDSRRIVRLSSQHLPRARAAANVSWNVHEWNVYEQDPWTTTIPMGPSWNIETGPASRFIKTFQQWNQIYKADETTCRKGIICEVQIAKGSLDACSIEFMVQRVDLDVNQCHWQAHTLSRGLWQVSKQWNSLRRICHL